MKERNQHPHEEYVGESEALASPEMPVAGTIPIIGLRPPQVDPKTGVEVMPGNFADPAITAQINDVASNPDHILAKLESADTTGERHTTFKWILGGAAVLTTLGAAAYLEHRHGWHHISEFRKKALELSEKLSSEKENNT